MDERLDIEAARVTEVDASSLTTAELLEHMLALEAVQVRLDVARRRLLAVRNDRRMGITRRAS